jgi:hypothetical protein
MTGVRVSIGQPTNGGRLHPRYDEESDILEVTTKSLWEWPYGVDIDGTIVFDLDAMHHLVNFDILAGRRLWKRGTVRRWPDEAASGRIIFSKETIDQESLHIPLRFVYDERRGILHVAFGDLKPDRELELSSECLALLSRTELAGFLLRGF